MTNPMRIEDGVVYIKVVRRNGAEYFVTVSHEDLVAIDIKFSCICLSKQTGKPNLFRAVGRVKGSGRKSKLVLLHRFIMKPTKYQQVDHRDNNPINNCRDNLRITTNQQNNQNRAGAYSNSKSGIRGVIWDSRRKKWRAEIKVNYRPIYIGSFEHMGDAEDAVKKARREHMPFNVEEAA